MLVLDFCISCGCLLVSCQHFVSQSGIVCRLFHVLTLDVHRQNCQRLSFTKHLFSWHNLIMSCQLQGIIREPWLVIRWWLAVRQSWSVSWCRHAHGETKENHKSAWITSNPAEIWNSYLLICLVHFLLLLHKCQLLHLKIAVPAGLLLMVLTIVGSSHCLLQRNFP